MRRLFWTFEAASLHASSTLAVVPDGMPFHARSTTGIAIARRRRPFRANVIHAPFVMRGVDAELSSGQHSLENGHASDKRAV